MGMKRSSGTARLEEQLVLAWKRYAARRIGAPEGVAGGACYLEPRPCPFEARPDFETRFTKNCVHCARLQGAVERAGSVPAGSSGVLPTQELLFRLLEEEGREPAAEPEEDGRTKRRRSCSARSRFSTPRRTPDGRRISCWAPSRGRFPRSSTRSSSSR